MKRLFGVILALLFCVPALAAQQPDALVVTGPAYQQMPIGSLPITTNGAQKSLANAILAAPGCTTNCTVQQLTATAGLTGAIGAVTASTGAFTTLSATTSFNNWTPVFSVLPNNNGTPTTGGTGNLAGDSLTLNAGCTGANQQNPIVTVTDATGGTVTNFTVTNAGACPQIPSGALSVLSSTGTGTGATFTLNWAPQAAYTPTFGAVAYNGGNFMFGSSLALTGAPPAFSGHESLFIAPLMGNIIGGGFDTVVGFGNCGSAGGTTITATALTCVGSNAGRNLAGNSVGNSIYLGTFGSASQPNITGGFNIVISAGNTQNLTSGSQNLFIQTGCGVAATVAGVTCLGYNTEVLNAGASNVVAVGANGAGGGIGAYCNTDSTCVGPVIGNANMTGSFYTLLGYEAAHTTCGAGHDLLMIATGFQGYNTVDCPSSSTSDWANVANALVASLAPPTVSSGFGTGPSVSAGTTTGAFQVNVGTGGTASSGVIQIATPAPHGWICHAVDGTNPATSNTVASPNATNPTYQVNLTNYSRTTGIATAWAASDVITVGCNGF